MTTYSPQDLINTIIPAGKSIKDNYLKPIEATDKADGTPVTTVDMQIHESLMAWANTQPELGYIGEEGNDFLPDCNQVLYVDPLDGTGGYRRGLASSTVVATIMKRYKDEWWPTLGAIYNPITGSIWVSDATRTMHLFDDKVNEVGSGEIVRVISNRKKSLVTVCTWPNCPHHLNQVEAVVNDSSEYDQQQFGSIALGAGLIASGMMDATLFAGNSAVETAAMSLIVRGAGGVATDLRGHTLEGYKLVEQGGKLDFHLPYGAIMSSSARLAYDLSTLVVFANQ